jgi:hypothetical protein
MRDARVHVPDITTRDGLLDFIMVGNLLEFSTVFDHYHHVGIKIAPEWVEERNVARWRYRLFQSWFNRRFILDMKDVGVNPCYLFNKSLIGFADALCSYLKRWERKVKLGISVKGIISMVTTHIGTEWQDLLSGFEKLRSQDPSKGRSLTWDGPNFLVLARDDSQVWKELQDFPDDPVYGDSDELEVEDIGSDMVEDQSDSDDHGRDVQVHVRDKRPTHGAINCIETCWKTHNETDDAGPVPMKRLKSK